MKIVKRFVKLVVGLFLLLVLGVGAGIYWIDSLAKTGIEKGSTYALGVPTKLNKADIGILSGRSELSGLNIDNPKGFDSEHFVKLDSGALAVSLGSLRSDTVEVPEFSLTGIDMNLEKKGGKSNYQVIIDNLGRFESGQKEEKAPREEKEGKKFVIKEIAIRNVKVHVDVLPVGGSLSRVTVPIDELRLENVGSGSDKGVMMAELTNMLIKAILLGAMENGKGIIPSDVLGELGGAMKNLDSLAEMGASLAVRAQGSLKQLKDSGGQVVEKLGDAAKDVQTDTEKALKGVGDLFKKKEDKK